MTKVEMLVAIKNDTKLIAEITERCSARIQEQLGKELDSVPLDALQNMQNAMENLRIAAEALEIGVGWLQVPPTTEKAS